MSRVYLIIVFSLFCFSSTTVMAESQEPFSFTHVAKKVIPSVVSIQVKKKVMGGPSSQLEEEFLRYFFDRGFGRRGPHGRDKGRREAPAGQGSGFIISKDGYILTNNHVVKDASQIEVKLQDGRTLNAKLIGTDAKSDVALIQVKEKNLPSLKLGDSESLEIGEWVIAVGNPFGLSATLTVGVVSAKGRANMGITDYEDFIQTDAAINPGNSGGPLMNIKGEVIGINTAIYSRSGGYMGIGFAIPIKMALKIKDQLIQYGEVRRGKIGVYIQEVTRDMAKQFGVPQQRGVLISEVMPNSPGERGGMKAGDVVIEMNGEEIESATHFRNNVALTRLGKELKLKVIRNRKERTLTVKIVPLNEIKREVKKRTSRERSSQVKSFGLEVEELTPTLRSRLQLSGVKGVLITDVTAQSVADKAGLEPGYIILNVNQKSVPDVDVFKREVKRSGDTILLRVRTNRGVRFFVLSR